jgi:hypothetical protein
MIYIYIVLLLFVVGHIGWKEDLPCVYGCIRVVLSYGFYIYIYIYIALHLPSFCLLIDAIT